MNKEIDKEEINELSKKAIQGAAAETVQRYGSAAKEHYVSYSGIDNENGKNLSKSLKDISNYKADDPTYKDSNIKQQAGFSAEVKTTAKRNADKILKGDKNRTIRTDDLGSVNDQLYDLADVDEYGNIIKGTQSQMKFVGNSPNELLIKLNSKKFQKYIDADALLDIADDDYDALCGTGESKGLIDVKIEKLNKEVDNLEKKGEIELAQKKKDQIKKYKKIKKNLRKTGMTRKEAIEARKHPKISVAKDVTKLGHEAGVKQAKVGATVAGSISIITNLVSCIKGEEAPEEAAKNVVISTGKGAALSYSSAFSGTVIKGAMQNSSSTYVRGLSKTNLPTQIVTTTVTVGKTMTQYIKGEISGVQCVEQLGKEGVGEIGSAMYSAIGVAAAKTALESTTIAATSAKGLAILGAAGMVGATIGYIAAIAVYKELSNSLKEYEIAKEERKRIEAECEEALKLILQ